VGAGRSTTPPSRLRTTASVSFSTRAPMASTWIEWARWSAKYTTIAMLANSSMIAPLTANRGNCSTRAPAASPTVYRPAEEYTNVATNTLNTTWFARSRRNLRSSRGENWVEDSCNATTVRPRTNAITVTTVPAMIVNNALASSAVPWNANGANGEPGRTSI
jgi:hypothetical protein